MKRILSIFFILFVLLGSVFAYVQLGPVRTVMNIQKSFHTGDLESLNDSIDFEAVRISLKQQVRDQIDQQNFFESESPLMKTLYSSLSYSLMDSMVDEYLKPETMQSLFQISQPSNDEVSDLANHTGELKTKKGKQNWFGLAREYLALCDFAYRSWGEFEISLKESINKPVSLAMFAGTRIQFKRSGMDWKVSDIIFPEAFLANEFK